MALVYNLYSDLIQLPHLLIGGSCGCGKSTLIDGLLYASMFQESPPTLVLIDPKRIDLLKYDKLKLTYARATRIDDALVLLRQLDDIMNRRYEEIEAAGGFVDISPRQNIYLVVDELADFTDTKIHGKKAAEFMSLLVHLVAVGRAARIHVIAATQTILASVVPTVLTNNMIVIALKCRTAGQSRVMIGEAGAESLPLHGEALINYGTRLDRVKVPMIPESDLRAILEYWRRSDDLNK